MALSWHDFVNVLLTFSPCLPVQELERKRKERAQVAYERKKQLTKLRVKAEKAAEEKLGPQLEIIAPIKY
jgi:large subunit ribosomal protein L13Ae